jgi:hypothetical protein
MPKIYYTECPCKGCQQRKAECHGTCEAYKTWKNEASEFTEPYYEHKKKRKKRT